MVVSLQSEVTMIVKKELKMRMVVEMMSLMTVKIQMEKMQSVVMVVVFHVTVVSDTHVTASEAVMLPIRMKVMLVVILDVLVHLVDIVYDVVRAPANTKEMLMLEQEEMKMVVVVRLSSKA